MDVARLTVEKFYSVGCNSYTGEKKHYESFLHRKRGYNPAFLDSSFCSQVATREAAHGEPVQLGTLDCTGSSPNTTHTQWAESLSQHHLLYWLEQELRHLPYIALNHPPEVKVRYILLPASHHRVVKILRFLLHFLVKLQNSFPSKFWRLQKKQTGCWWKFEVSLQIQPPLVQSSK